MTENNIIRKENIDPFKNKILNDGLNITSFIKSLQTIPKIYFEIGKNTNSIGVGNDIINSYNNIKTNIKKMDIIKNFILSILKTSQNDFKKIKVSKLKYKLDENNLIYRDSKFLKNKTSSITIDAQVDNIFKDENNFKEFIKNFNNNRYDIIKKNKNILPYFFRIFQAEYKITGKDFFISLFRKYIKIRIYLLEYVKYDYGLLAFDSFFNLEDIINFQSSVNSYSNNQNKKDNNLEKYMFYNNNNNIDNNINNNTVHKKKNTTTTKVIEPTLNSKINKFNLLYLNINNQHSYKDKNLENINNYRSKIIELTDNIVGSNASYDLYNIIVNMIQLDFNLISCVFNYVDPTIFDKSVDIHFKIKDYIYDKINNFELYYEDYIDWYNQLINATDTSSIKDYSKVESDFDSFFDKIFKDLNKNKNNNENNEHNNYRNFSYGS